MPEFSSKSECSDTEGCISSDDKEPVAFGVVAKYR
jgi:hypothetical protein